MLNILQKNILLGTGGLVRAYTDSLQIALEKSKKICICEGVKLEVFIDYSEYNNFCYYCKSNNILITNVDYGELIKIEIELEEVKKEKLNKDFETKKIILKKVRQISKKYISKTI